MTIERTAGRRGARAAARSIAGNERLAPETKPAPELQQLVASLSGEVERLRRDLQVAQDRLEEAERVADQDHLLPVLNRRAFKRELTRHLGLVSRYGTRASLVYFDLDGFKRVNDTFGHAAGDAVLAHFAETLCRNVRDSDVVGRLGGDEFAIILSYANETQAKKKADALMDALSASPAEWDNQFLPIGFSFGAFELAVGETAEGAISRADASMYAQKRGSQNVRR